MVDKIDEKTLDDFVNQKHILKDNTNLVQLTNKLQQALCSVTKGFETVICTSDESEIKPENKAFSPALNAIQQAYQSGHLEILDPEILISVGRMYKTDDKGNKYSEPVWAGINISPVEKEVNLHYLTTKQLNAIYPILKPEILTSKKA